MEGMSLEELTSAADATLEETASRLRETLAELASRLRPFPSFLNMVSVQAVELEPPLQPTADLGCVVVCPDGEICELEVVGIPGVAGVSDVEQIEQFKPLELTVEEYIVYATTAIRALADELRRRGQ